MADNSDAKASNKDKDLEATAPPAAGAASRYQQTIDKVRARSDVTGKTLGALGTTAATAVGLAKLGDLFPIQHKWQHYAWLLIALAGFAVAAAAVLYVAVRLSSVARPVFMRTDLQDMKDTGDLDDGELKAVKSVFKRWANADGAESLAAYEARAARLRRIATWTSDETECKRRKTLADEIESNIRSAFGIAALRVVRQRTTDALTGKRVRGAYVAFVLGIIGFALGSDYLVSQRSDSVAIAKSCGEARKAGATGPELPEVCTDPDEPKKELPQDPSAEQQRLELVRNLLKTLRDCETAAAEGPLAPDVCRPIRLAVQSGLE